MAPSSTRAVFEDRADAGLDGAADDAGLGQVDVVVDLDHPVLGQDRRTRPSRPCRARGRPISPPRDSGLVPSGRVDVNSADEYSAHSVGWPRVQK